MKSIITMLHIYLIWLALNLIKESSGQIVITQTPASVHVNPGDRVTIHCKASSSMSDDMALYQFIPGKKPKLLLYDSSSRFTGTPDRFSGSYSGTEFTFTISGVRPEDEAEYYCGQHYSYPYTFGVATKLQIKRKYDATPLASIFPPSQEQLKTNSATVVCLVTRFYPSELNVVWKADGKAVTGDVQTSSAASEADKTYKLSSTLTLSRDEYNSHETYSCEVTHKTLTEPLVKSFRRSECPS
nr:immunoglobulin kappa light chain-like [Anolis sagrei ordinatus]